MHSDEFYMQRCIDLAKLGSGSVAPNPMVGAVIVHNDRIIGEGYHMIFGGPHAEVNAIKSVKEKNLLPESTIYVSLEPCAHFGKTPPCCDLIVAKQFKRVVIGIRDPFSKVDGAGIERISNAGIEVKVGVLEQECKELNKAFITAHTLKRPYITLKWAQTPSGKIDAGQSNKEVNWISAPETQVFTHQLRVENQAILVGYNTVINDDPSLTVRAVNGPNPIRVVLDKEGTLNKDHKVFNSEAETIVLSENEPKHILSALYDKGIISVLIEGGRKTLQTFIDDDLWDEAYMIVGQTDFENGTSAPLLDQTEPKDTYYLGGDLIKHFVR